MIILFNFKKNPFKTTGAKCLCGLQAKKNEKQIWNISKRMKEFHAKIRKKSF